MADVIKAGIAVPGAGKRSSQLTIKQQPVKGPAQTPRARMPKEEIEAVRAKLVELFPKCFLPAGGAKLPLKIGIYQDLRERTKGHFSARKLKNALIDYTRGLTYHDAMVAGASRVDLDGEPAGSVTADEAEYYRVVALRMRGQNAFWREMKALRSALRHAIAVANEAREEWDKAPNDMRAGKILIALAGGCPGYRSDIDAIHAALELSATTESQ